MCLSIPALLCTHRATQMWERTPLRPPRAELQPRPPSTPSAPSGSPRAGSVTLCPLMETRSFVQAELRLRSEQSACLTQRCNYRRRGRSLLLEFFSGVLAAIRYAHNVSDCSRLRKKCRFDFQNHAGGEVWFASKTVH